MSDIDDWNPVFAPWDGRRVPVTLLGGYLGAGKTTALNELLRSTDEPIAIIVNDIGEINIDASLVAARHGDTIELTDGCICCSLIQGLAPVFDQLRSRPTPPSHLVMELSGAAEPRRLIPWADSVGFRLDGIVVFADLEQITDHLDHPAIGPLVRAQLEGADLIVATKADLCSQSHRDTALAAIQAINPDAPVRASNDPGVAAGLLRLGGRRAGGVTDLPPPSLFDPHVTSTRPFPDLDTPTDVDGFLDDLPTDTVRAKGVARTAGGDKLLVQVVGRRREVMPLPAAEDQPPTDLVIIQVPSGVSAT